MHQAITNLADICARQGLRHIIISPGSRSAPLTVAFARHPQLDCRVVMDERAAAFIALGLAQQSGQPVGLVCTSGTAPLNYGPAVAEAFYQNVPLLLFTADRPPEWIEQQDNQTIRQQHLYGHHCRASFELPVDTGHPDARWHLERLLSEAINAARHPLPGPVQINVPLREPLYPSPEIALTAEPDPKLIHLTPAQASLSPETWSDLIAAWQGARRKMILVGAHPPDVALAQGLAALAAEPDVAILADLTANLHPANLPLQHWDQVLGTRDEGIRRSLAPDLLLTCGGPVVSKGIKLFLRRYRPAAHWHIQPAGPAPDTYQALTQIIPTSAAYFFAHLAAAQMPTSAGDYAATWQAQEQQARRKLDTFLTEAPFGEFAAAAMVMRALPEPGRLQLGNSMPVRYAEIIGLAGRKVRVDSNRGTSGIDGTVSTAVGAAMATAELTTLIVGDLGFFYDRNALWHNHLPVNLRIVVLNNHGGGIFKLIDGPDNLPPDELDTYFQTPHPLTARRTAADHGCAYFHCADAAGLAAQLSHFFASTDRPAILEVETDSDRNAEIYRQFKVALA